jgi:hypothetical protein
MNAPRLSGQEKGRLHYVFSSWICMVKAYDRVEWISLETINDAETWFLPCLGEDHNEIY